MPQNWGAQGGKSLPPSFNRILLAVVICGCGAREARVLIIIVRSYFRMSEVKLQWSTMGRIMRSGRHAKETSTSSDLTLDRGSQEV